MEKSSRLRWGFRLLVAGVLLLGLGELLVAFAPISECPSCRLWARELKAPFKPLRGCPSCDGTGRVTPLRKTDLDDRIQKNGGKIGG